MNKLAKQPLAEGDRSTRVPETTGSDSEGHILDRQIRSLSVANMSCPGELQPNLTATLPPGLCSIFSNLRPANLNPAFVGPLKGLKMQNCCDRCKNISNSQCLGWYWISDSGESNMNIDELGTCHLLNNIQGPYKGENGTFFGIQQEETTATGTSKNTSYNDSLIQSCPLLWTKKGALCYRVVSAEAKSWDDADADCRQSHPKALLPRFSNSLEYWEFRSARTTLLGNFDVWTASRDRGDTGHFTTESVDGEVCANPEAFWYFGRPAYKAFNCAGDQYQDIPDGYSGGWWPHSCDTELRFLCQISDVDICAITRGHCMAGWMQALNGDCYTNAMPFVPTELTPVDGDVAEAACRSIHPNATLPVFGSQEDYASFVTVRNAWLDPTRDIWMGISKNEITKNWEYLDGDGERRCPAPFVNWNTGTPAWNTATLNRYAYAYSSNSYWFDVKNTRSPTFGLCQLREKNICDQSRGNCEDGWLELGGDTCFKLGDRDGKTHKDAVQACRALNDAAVLPAARHKMDFQNLNMARQSLLNGQITIWFGSHVPVGTTGKWVVDDPDGNRSCYNPGTLWWHYRPPLRPETYCSYLLIGSTIQVPYTDIYYVYDILCSSTRNVICTMSTWSVCDISRGACPEGWLAKGKDCFIEPGADAETNDFHQAREKCRSLHPDAVLPYMKAGVPSDDLKSVVRSLTGQINQPSNRFWMNYQDIGQNLTYFVYDKHNSTCAATQFFGDGGQSSLGRCFTLSGYGKQDLAAGYEIKLEQEACTTQLRTICAIYETDYCGMVTQGLSIQQSFKMLSSNNLTDVDIYDDNEPPVTSLFTCPPGWIRSYNGSACYYPLIYEKLTWTEAELWCHRLHPNATLPLYRNDDELEEIKNVMVSRSMLLYDGSKWLGLAELIPDVAWMASDAGDRLCLAPYPTLSGSQDCIAHMKEQAPIKVSCGIKAHTVCQIRNWSYCDEIEQDCPPGWMQFGRSCYSPAKLTSLPWSDAWQTCRDNNGRLPIFQNESDFEDFLSAWNVLLPNAEKVSIGYKYEPTVRTWLAIDFNGTQSYAAWTAWSTGEPYTMSNVASYVELNTWYTMSESSNAHALCQLDQWSLNDPNNYNCPEGWLDAGSACYRGMYSSAKNIDEMTQSCQDFVQEASLSSFETLEMFEDFERAVVSIFPLLVTPLLLGPVLNGNSWVVENGTIVEPLEFIKLDQQPIVMPDKCSTYDPTKKTCFLYQPCVASESESAVLCQLKKEGLISTEVTGCPRLWTEVEGTCFKVASYSSINHASAVGKCTEVYPDSQLPIFQSRIDMVNFIQISEKLGIGSANIAIHTGYMKQIFLDNGALWGWNISNSNCSAAFIDSLPNPPDSSSSVVIIQQDKLVETSLTELGLAVCQISKETTNLGCRSCPIGWFSTAEACYKVFPAANDFSDFPAQCINYNPRSVLPTFRNGDDELEILSALTIIDPSITSIAVGYPNTNCYEFCDWNNFDPCLAHEKIECSMLTINGTWGIVSNCSGNHGLSLVCQVAHWNIDNDHCKLDNLCGQSQTCVSHSAGYKCIEEDMIQDMASLLENWSNNNDETMYTQLSLQANFDEILSYLMDKIDASELDELFYKLADLLLDCSYNNVDCKWQPEDWSQFRHPRFGQCFSYNNNRTVGRKSASSAGHQTGLKLALDLQPQSYLTSSDTTAIALALHTPEVFPFPESEGFSIAAGYSNIIAMKYVKIRNMDQPYGKCIDNSRQLTAYYYSGDYSTSACDFTNLQIATLKACNCSNPKYGHEPDNKTCDFDKRGCVDEIEAWFITENDVQCEKSCWVEHFPMILTKSLLIKELGMNCVNCFSRNGMARVNIYYETLTFQYLEQKPALTIVQLLSAIGGSLGITLGMSIISLVEIMFIIMMSLFAKVLKI